jgi:FAD/FMN-containing dehydrogenase/Fe-S oxidoreductase
MLRSIDRAIPRLNAGGAPAPLYLRFVEALAKSGFEGEVSTSEGDRTVFSTDNSIFQVTPQCVAFPKHHDDVVSLLALAGNAAWKEVKVTPRGGGTGTNGQSLTNGLVVDLSRHMNQILEIDLSQRIARVQSGVVKDQLNAALRTHGLFFAPELSTSNRATVGGMVNTDASGQGSVVYGKTRDHVLELRTALLGGESLRSRAIDSHELSTMTKLPSKIGAVYRLLENLEKNNRALIKKHFPPLTRSLTGYDLAHLRRTDGRFDLNSVLCGAEGTLGLVTEATLNVLPIPKHAAIIAIQYRSFDAALRDARALMALNPTSIETVDSMVLQLARTDRVWPAVREYIPDTGTTPAQGINLVEYLGDDLDALNATLARVDQLLGEQQKDTTGRLIHVIARGEEAVNNLWEMRKRAVGLLGKLPGKGRPVPFVEDTAVPPENLADYIADFRALLDSHQLRYGMFGHVDAGVLHVRPALDMIEPKHDLIMWEVSDQVARLTAQYGGVLWGEHGKGFRSQYAPSFFGPVYGLLQEIKAAFDPYNQLNPGKIASPAAHGLVQIADVPTRGAADRRIPIVVRQDYPGVMSCNGNGACYNFDLDDPMCPSWKSTRERRHSPKGRASLMREWLARLSVAGVDEHALLANPAPRDGFLRRLKNSVARKSGEYDFSNEVMDAMQGCLACKACATQCPVSVDVPSFRARFMALYYGRYLRPMRDHVVGGLETLLPWAAKMPKVYEAISQNPAAKWLHAKIGLVDVPELAPTRLDRALSRQGFTPASLDALAKLTPLERRKHVLIVQDVFTRYFDTQVAIDAFTLLRHLGFEPHAVQYLPNGKALQVHGFLERFERVAAKNAQQLAQFAKLGVSLVGIEPATTLTYRSEYRSTGSGVAEVNVQLIQEWLVEAVATSPKRSERVSIGDVSYRLLAHCTERANAPSAVDSWKELFSRFGASVDLVSVGCCGMAGTFGHEIEHRDQSERIYSQSWKSVVEDETRPPVLSDGFSCRCQAKRFSSRRLQHPIQALLAVVTGDVDGSAGARSLGERAFLEQVAG